MGRAIYSDGTAISRRGDSAPYADGGQASAMVATTNPRVGRSVARALGALGVAVDSTGFESGETELALSRRRDLYLVDTHDDMQGARRLLDRIRAIDSDAPVLVLFRNLRDPFLLDLVANRGVNNLIARHGGLSASDDLIDEGELITTCNKLITRDIFGLEKYLNAWGAKIHCHRVRGTADKAATLTGLSHYLERIRCPRSIVPEIIAVVDELLMNAIFHAPRTAAGLPKYERMQRSRPLVLEPGERVDVAYASDGRHVSVAVRDNFGQLHRSAILSYLEHAFLGVPVEVHQGSAAAGVGLHLVFNSATQLVFNVHCGEQSEVVARFYIRGGSRDFRASGRSLNIFSSA